MRLLKKRDKEHPAEKISRTVEDFELQELLDENSTETLLELSKALNVTPKAVSKHLHAMGKIIRKGYGYHMSCQKMPF